MPKIEPKYKTLGFDLSKRAFNEMQDPDYPGKNILVQKTPDEIYAEIQASSPENLILFVDELLQQYPDIPLTKDFMAFKLWGGPPLGFRTVKYGNQNFDAPYWINSSRDRLIRNAVGDLVEYLCRTIVASSHEVGYTYCVTNTEAYEKGLADLRQRYNTMGKRLAALEKAGVIMRDKLPITPIADNRLLVQKSLGI